MNIWIRKITIPRQRLCKHAPIPELSLNNDARKNRRIVESDVFYAVRAEAVPGESKQSTPSDIKIRS